MLFALTIVAGSKRRVECCYNGFEIKHSSQVGKPNHCCPRNFVQGLLNIFLRTRLLQYSTHKVFSGCKRHRSNAARARCCLSIHAKCTRFTVPCSDIILLEWSFFPRTSYISIKLICHVAILHGIASFNLRTYFWIHYFRLVCSFHQCPYKISKGLNFKFCA